jgi:hypothetical protein
LLFLLIITIFFVSIPLILCPNKITKINALFIKKHPANCQPQPYPSQFHPHFLLKTQNIPHPNPIPIKSIQSSKSNQSVDWEVTESQEKPNSAAAASGAICFNEAPGERLKNFEAQNKRWPLVGTPLIALGSLGRQKIISACC